MITYFYDKEADVFYFSEGVPHASDETVETSGDVLLRISPRTKRVRGVTILNASHRAQSAETPAPLHFSLVATT